MRVARPRKNKNDNTRRFRLSISSEGVQSPRNKTQHHAGYRAKGDIAPKKQMTTAVSGWPTFFVQRGATSTHYNTARTGLQWNVRTPIGREKKNIFRNESNLYTSLHPPPPVARPSHPLRFHHQSHPGRERLGTLEHRKVVSSWRALVQETDVPVCSSA